ncbi:hypothetical protein ABTW96_24400 [Nocardia beijingensis]
MGEQVSAAGERCRGRGGIDNNADLVDAGARITGALQHCHPTEV